MDWLSRLVIASLEIEYQALAAKSLIPDGLNRDEPFFCSGQARLISCEENSGFVLARAIFVFSREYIGPLRHGVEIRILEVVHVIDAEVERQSIIIFIM